MTFDEIAPLLASQAAWRTKKDRPERRLPGFCRHLVPSTGLSETRELAAERVLAGPISQRRTSSRDTYCNLINSGPW